MSAVEAHVDVVVPLSTAYDEWTRFEQLPRFLEGVEEVRQLDETHLRWRASYDGVAAEWDCEIIEQRPDERIAWRSTTGIAHAGVVTFHRLGDRETRVMIMAEADGEMPALVGDRIKDALERFRQLIEA